MSFQRVILAQHVADCIAESIVDAGIQYKQGLAQHGGQMADAVTEIASRTHSAGRACGVSIQSGSTTPQNSFATSELFGIVAPLAHIVSQDWRPE
jgi:hypothetical protein